MKINELYKKMIAENLSYRQLAALIKPAITHVGLYYHIKRYCVQNNLALPKNKAGRKVIDRNFELNNR
jgi:hypothetical protein